MNKQIIFFDGDGTLWYPERTKRSQKPHWIYFEESTKDNYLQHLILTPKVVETLNTLRAHGIKTAILSTHPQSAEEASRVLQEKVTHFGLLSLFDYIYATADYPKAKGQKALEILHRLHIAQADALMVGDSYKWDYQPMAEVGIDAALIDSSYHQEKLKEEPVVTLINSLEDLVPLLGISYS